jgi:SAM-dependent methyltransferase
MKATNLSVVKTMQQDENPSSEAGDDTRISERKIAHRDGQIKELTRMAGSSLETARQTAALLADVHVATSILVEIVPALMQQRLATSVFVRLGEACHELGENDAARACFERALVDGPNTDALSNLGALAYAAGDSDIAEQYFLRAIEIDPGNDEVSHNLMLLRATRSRTEKPTNTDVAQKHDDVEAIKQYIQRFQSLCDRYLSRLVNPAGKSVLVIGSGGGTEMLWAIRHSAHEVVGIDPATRDTKALDVAVAELKAVGLQVAPYRMCKMTSHEAHTLGRKFDLIVSCNVFEHIQDVRETLLSLRPLLREGGRIAIFVDPLYYSSAGAHISIAPWEHLLDRERIFLDQITARERDIFKTQLNRMTFLDFVGFVRDAGLLMLDLFVVPDRNLGKIGAVYKKLKESSRIAALDLAIEGFGCLLCFPEDVKGHVDTGASPAREVAHRDEIPLPPRELRFMNESDEVFRKIGAANLDILRRHGFGESTQLLDIGCGYGRLPIAIAQNMDYCGEYLGVDILSRHVKWCQDNITPRYANMRFGTMDIRNDRYNPTGHIDACEYRFPFNAASFEMACLFSVFTHMYEPEIVHYLEEMRRVLTGGGTVVATFFLMDADRMERVCNAPSGLAMRHELNAVTRYHNATDPLHAIAYDRQHISRRIEEAGFRIRDCVYGHWAGDASRSFQDVMVFSAR